MFFHTHLYKHHQIACFSMQLVFSATNNKPFTFPPCPNTSTRLIHLHQINSLSLSLSKMEKHIIQTPNSHSLINSSSSQRPFSPPPPTTFVQADAHTFRDLVQRLTGADDESPENLPARPFPARASDRGGVGPRRSAFKLQERRQNVRINKLEIKSGLRNASPSPSPVTPLGSNAVFSGGSSPAAAEEERAIAKKGFYLHPSPLSTPRGAEPPELLPLFPLTSPKQEQQAISPQHP